MIPCGIYILKLSKILIYNILNTRTSMLFLSRINKIDVLICLLAIYLCVFCDIHTCVDNNLDYNPLILGLMTYTAARLIQVLVPKYCDYFFLSVLFVILVLEIKKGCFQILHSKEALSFCLTGSFIQSGLYGGFISVLICVFCGFLLSDKSVFHKYIFGGNESIKKKIVSQIIQYVLIIIGIVTLFLIFCTQSRTSILALVCSLSILSFKNDKFLSLVKKHRLKILLFLITFGAVAYFYKKPSADGRFLMNRVSLLALTTNNWNGVGGGHFGGAYGEAQASLFAEMMSRGDGEMDWRVINEGIRLTADCPTKAFNEYLNVGVEYGIIAMLLLMGIIITAIVQSFKNDNAWCFGLIVFSVFAFFSYPLHSTQFQLLFPFLLATCGWDRVKGNNIYTILFCVFILSFTVCMNKKQGNKIEDSVSVEWTRANYWYNIEEYENVVECCDTLLPYMSQDYRFLFIYGQSLNKTGNYEKSDSVLKIGCKISSDPMFWNVMGNNSLAVGNYREAEECYKHAFCMVPNRLYPLYLLAKLYYTEDNTVDFLKMAEEVESFVPKVESVNTESLRMEIRELKSEYLKLTR